MLARRQQSERRFLIGLLILANMSRCAIPEFCPTDEKILAAVRARDADVVQAIANQAAQDDPDSVVLTHSERIKRISGVLCGDKLPSDLPGDPPVINCKFTVRYWSRNAETVARMVRRGDEWEIDAALAVTRARR